MLRFILTIFLLFLTFSVNGQVNFVDTIKQPTPVIVSYGKDENLYFTNDLVGASAWYEVGVFGNGATVANVELGVYWEEHEAFSNTNIGTIFTPDGADKTSLYDGHATATAGVIAGFKEFDTSSENPDVYAYAACGIAPHATLSAGGVASKIYDNGSADVSMADFEKAYKYFFRENSQDVINSSWGPVSETAGTYYSTFIDALAYENKYTSMTISAGNKIDHPSTQLNRPTSLAQSFNAISVGALDNPPDYDKLAEFSVTSPSDFYNPITQEYIENVRPAVDICTAGADIFGAYYDSTNTSVKNDYYTMSGTSFSAPIVAGTIALMTSLSKELEAREDFSSAGWNADARDSRVIKAVLLNSADKPKDWDNGQSVQDKVEFKVEFEGIQGAYSTQTFDNVIKTTQGLDFNYGAGMLNAEKALDQYVGLYTTGTTNNVWLLDEVNFTASNLYHIGEIDAGATLTMTLVWQAIYEFFAETDANGNATESIVNPALTDLSLELWVQLADGTFAPVAISDTKYNNVEHLSVTLAGVADCYARVAYFDMSYGENIPTETYALAWNIITAVPEPAEWALIFGGVVLLFAIRRKRK